ncbi:MAG: TonB family protein [Hyphomonadaceae bacterium]|nr:TonB family protein [Hyphomonadaceae bacterium]
MLRSILKLVAAGILSVVALPAFADIAAFNAAMKAKDFKAATAAAAETWPTLDKSSEDIALIAREFGFAAHFSGDHVAAKTYAEFAVARDTAESSRVVSAALLRLAEHKLDPSRATRTQLSDAMTARAAQPGLDNISYLAVDALLAYDFEKGNWKDAQQSSELAVQLTTRGGSVFLLQKRRFELYNAVADYLAQKKRDTYDDLTNLRKAMLDDIDAMPSEEAAERFVPLYWEVTAWHGSLESHLYSGTEKRFIEQRRKQEGQEDKAKIAAGEKPTARRERLLHHHDIEDPCRPKLEMKRIPQYPSSAMFRGMVGAVILQVDIDETGAVKNPKILAAAPEKFFGKAVLDNYQDMRFERSEESKASNCGPIAETGHPVTFFFHIAR